MSTINLFENLIFPHSQEEFFDAYWEKQPLYIERNNPDLYSDLLSKESIEQLIASTELEYPYLRLAKDNKILPPGEFTNHAKKVIAGHVFSLHSQGATINLNQLDKLWKPVGYLCRHLEMLYSHSFQANAYQTPANSQGFSVHYDTHEVFVLQISGTKKWTIYESQIEYPIPMLKRSLTEPLAPTPAMMELELKPGDLLYVPRGFPHNARTADSSSLHITLLSPTLTWGELAVRVVGRSWKMADYRQSIPVGFASNDFPLDQLQNDLAEKLVEFARSEEFRKYLEDAIEKYTTTPATL